MIENAVESAKEIYFYEGNDNDIHDAIHEVADNHVIYYSDCDFILSETRNEDAYEDAGAELDPSKGWQGMKTVVAYYAIAQDISEKIDHERWETLKNYLDERKARAA
jgi:hypothetical protein